MTAAGMPRRRRRRGEEEGERVREEKRAAAVAVAVRGQLLQTASAPPLPNLDERGDAPLEQWQRTEEKSRQPEGEAGGVAGG